MAQILKTTHPKAKKRHTCMYCGCNIEEGEVYERNTCVYDGQVYDWVSHTDCQAIAEELRMFDDCEECLTGDDFCEYINDYVLENYKNNENIINMSEIEQVRMILKDLQN